MKPRRIALIAGLGLLSAGAGSAQARCNMRCLTHKVNSLQSQVRRDTRTLNSVVTCISEVAITQYSGYIFNPNGGPNIFYVTALDATGAGDAVSLWMLYDRCDTSTKSAHGRFVPNRSPWGRPISRRP